MSLSQLWLDLVYEVTISIWTTIWQTNLMAIVCLLYSPSGLSECSPQAQGSALLEQLSCAKIVLRYIYSQLLPPSLTGHLLWAKAHLSLLSLQVLLERWT